MRRPALAVPFAAFFGAIELMFFFASLTKFAHGGYVTVAMAAAIFYVIFSGFLAGFGYYIQYVKLAPDYIPEMVDKFPFEDESVAEATKTLLSSVGYWIMVAVFQMAFLGSLVGVIISLIIRRKHDKIGCEKEELSQENNSDETIQ
jgi:K+ transporter